MKLNEKGIFKKHDTEEFYDNIKELMGNIKKDIDDEINKKNLDEFINIPESIMKHLESGFNIDSFLRFILNIKDNNYLIKEGYKAIERNVTDYQNQYDLYNKNSLDSISKYITSVFQENRITLEEHYDKMKIIFKNENNLSHRSYSNILTLNNKCKGIYFHKCENNSMEFILNLYWDKIGELPIAQNVLITNKETSSEEMQAFFHRAILCNYNILFVVEINDSFSENKQSIMNRYISNLLSEKFKNYKEETKDDDVKKDETGKYMDSCIVFIYDKKNKNNIFFL